MKPTYLFDVVHVPTGVSVVLMADSFKDIYDLVREQFGNGAENEVTITIRNKE